MESDYVSVESRALLKTVAEELRLPLMQIARRAELAQLTERFTPEAFQEVRFGARAALELIDSYTLGLQLAEDQQLLELEPVSVSSILYDTAHSLNGVAKHYQVDLELQVRNAGGPVMAHAAGLRAALFSLGYAVIEALPAADGQQVLRLVTYRTPRGTVAGLYGDGMQAMSNTHLRTAHSLYGRAQQPLNQLSGGSAAGVFVASSILRAMAARLKTSRYHKQAGLAALLQPSRQLQLV